MKKLIIYGDSILRGITYSAELARHKLCAGYELKSLGEIGYEVKNRSRMGATILRGTEILEKTISDCDKSSVVLFEFGGNDCDHDWQAVSEHPSEQHGPHIDASTFRESYKKAIERVRATGATVLMANMIPIDAERYMRTISRCNSYDNILSWLGDPSMLYRFQEHYNRIVEGLSLSLSCPMIDLRGSFLLSHDYKELISEDGIHPTEAGHDMIERELRHALLQLNRGTPCTATA